MFLSKKRDFCVFFDACSILKHFINKVSDLFSRPQLDKDLGCVKL